MKLKKKIAKIEIDIENGLKFKSADRLRNMINQYPDETELWNRLAELYYESGFLASAGKYWILTEPKDNRIKKSVELYEKSVNSSGTKILQDITFRGDKTKLSEFGKNKLRELELDSKKKSNYIPKFKPLTNINKKTKTEKQSFKEKFFGYLITGSIIAIIIFTLIGFITVVKYIF